jgi:hypothetical protein
VAWSAPPFSGVRCSGRWCGVNVGSRVFRAGFTGTRGVLVSAVPSAGVGGPAPLLRGPGIEVMLIVMGLAPAGQVDRGVEVAISRIPTAAGENPIGQQGSGNFSVALCGGSGQVNLSGQGTVTSGKIGVC